MKTIPGSLASISCVLVAVPIFKILIAIGSNTRKYKSPQIEYSCDVRLTMAVKCKFRYVVALKFGAQYEDPILTLSTECYRESIVIHN